MLVTAILLMTTFLVLLPLAKPSNVIVPAIYQTLQDYQDDPMGGNGWLRLYTFEPTKNQILVQTYSPYLEKFEVDSNSKFTLPYEMNGTQSFTIAVLPDTQYYSANHPEIFTHQIQWIVDNHEVFNIVFVIHLGDVIEDMTSIQQWINADNTMELLQNAEIPYSILPGNHDYDENDPSSKTTFESYFGASNTYYLLEIDQVKLLILSLQYKPDTSTVTWAENVIQTYPEYKVIVATHEYLFQSGWLPGQRSATGNMLFSQLIQPNNQQVFLVLSGHYNREDLVTDYLNTLQFLTWWIS
jgi:hypothetical protein